MMKKQLLFLSMILGFISLSSLHAQCPPTGSAHPAEGEFVQDQWTAYAYNREGNWFFGYYYDYQGYYLDNNTYGNENINVDSENSWTNNVSPSAASNYQGCSINNDDHRVLYTRKGFPEGYYEISTRHDDEAWVEIDGVRVYNESDWVNPNDPKNIVGTYYLDQNTEIAFEWTESSGESNGLLEFSKIPVESGNNEWKVTVFNDIQFTSLAGTFTQAGLNFSTLDKWQSNQTPSNAPNYVGSTVSNNNSYIYSRKGFPCGVYTIDIARHDDNAELIIDGVTVWSRTGYLLSPIPNVWSGILDADSEIKLKISNNGGGPTSAGLTFNKTSPEGAVIWTGKVSTNTSNPANWCPNLPNDTSNVYIPDASMTDFNPVLNSNASITSLNISPNAILDVTNHKLEVSGNFINQGILTNNLVNNLSLNGNSSTISGKGFQVNTLTSKGSNVNINLNANEEIRVNDVVKVPSGNLDTNNQLVLACQLTDLSKRVAQIDDLSNGAIIGEIETEQCIPARRAFRFVSSTVTTSNSIHDNWQEGATSWDDNPNPGYGTHITGTQTDQTNGFDATTSGNPSLFVYDNATQTWSAIANTDVNTLTAGTAYRLMVRGDRSTDIKSNLASASPTTLRATGTIVSGNLDLAAGFDTTNGSFNFFGNPYPAAIDMSQVMTGATGVQKDYYVWDPNLGGTDNSNQDSNNIGGRGGFVTVDLESGSNSAGSAANQFLQPGQAAFVRVATSGTPEMLLTESNKNVSVNQTATFSTNPISMVDLTLYSADDLSNGETAKDGVRLKFSDNYSTSPSHEDAAKFGNIDENVAVINNGQYLAIDRRELPINEEVIPLFFNQYRTNDYSLSFNLNEMQAYDIYVVDAYLNEETLISEDNFVFNFNVDVNISESIDANRFSLKLQPVTLGLEDVTSENFRMYPNPLTDGRLTIDLPQNMQGQFNVKIHNVLGSSVLDLQKEAEGGQISLSNLNLSAGVYFVKIKSENTQTSFTQKLIVK